MKLGMIVRIMRLKEAVVYRELLKPVRNGDIF